MDFLEKEEIEKELAHNSHTHLKMSVYYNAASWEWERKDLETLKFFIK